MLNGVALAVDAASVDTIVFQGQGGSDSATLSGGSGGSTLTLTPGTNVTDQVIKASWTGFDPTDTLGDFAVWLYQCKADPKTLADCYTAAPFPDIAQGNAMLNGVTKPDGTGSAFIELISALGTSTGPLSVSTRMVSPRSWIFPRSLL